MRSRFGALAVVVGLMWLVYGVDALLELGLVRFGIRPRILEGLVGVVTWPFLHGGLAHLLGNTAPLLLFGGIISARSSRTFLGLTVYTTLMAGLAVWLIGRDAIHIGASGLVFSYFGYIVTRGFYDRRLLSVALSVVIIILFGGIIWGVLPNDLPISWEGHLAGIIAGGVFASRSKRKGYR